MSHNALMTSGPIATSRYYSYLWDPNEHELESVLEHFRPLISSGGEGTGFATDTSTIPGKSERRRYKDFELWLTDLERGFDQADFSWWSDGNENLSIDIIKSSGSTATLHISAEGNGPIDIAEELTDSNRRSQLTLISDKSPEIEIEQERRYNGSHIGESTDLITLANTCSKAIGSDLITWSQLTAEGPSILRRVIHSYPILLGTLGTLKGINLVSSLSCTFTSKVNSEEISLYYRRADSIIEITARSESIESSDERLDALEEELGLTRSSTSETKKEGTRRSFDIEDSIGRDWIGVLDSTIRELSTRAFSGSVLSRVAEGNGVGQESRYYESQEDWTSILRDRLENVVSADAFASGTRGDVDIWIDFQRQRVDLDIRGQSIREVEAIRGGVQGDLSLVPVPDDLRWQRGRSRSWKMRSSPGNEEVAKQLDKALRIAFSSDDYFNPAFTSLDLKNSAGSTWRYSDYTSFIEEISSADATYTNVFLAAEGRLGKSLELGLDFGSSDSEGGELNLWSALTKSEHDAVSTHLHNSLELDLVKSVEDQDEEATGKANGGSIVVAAARWVWEKAAIPLVTAAIALAGIAWFVPPIVSQRGDVSMFSPPAPAGDNPSTVSPGALTVIWRVTDDGVLRDNASDEIQSAKVQVLDDRGTPVDGGVYTGKPPFEVELEEEGSYQVIVTPEHDPASVFSRQFVVRNPQAEGEDEGS